MVRSICGARHFDRTDGVEVVEADALKRDTLGRALADVDTAYYLIHSMKSGGKFEELDRAAAEHFGQTARACGVKHIVYLGGLGGQGPNLSKHLRSRHEVGDILRQSGVRVTEFRASIIVGAGSISFEMIRYLTERIPIMICPRWVYTRVQPIAVDDVLAYLAAAAKKSGRDNRIIEIGGSEVLTYGDMMKVYAKLRGLRRTLIRVPVLTPHLSAYWVHWVTPIRACFAHPLIEGLRSETVADTKDAQQVFPEICPISYVEAVTAALSDLNPDAYAAVFVGKPETSGKGCTVKSATLDGMIIEWYETAVAACPARVFEVVSSLGGENGWLYADGLWKLRAALDRLIGGVGLRRSESLTRHRKIGDTVDFFRVEAVDPPDSLRLRAEMKLPGAAWIEFEVKSGGPKEAKLLISMFYAPKGLLGLLYWYALCVPHRLMFSRMIRRIASKAEAQRR
jgi:uncharacterized protein YbjT (DUF2867 family)